MNDGDVTREIVLRAGRELVWCAITDPGELSQWLSAEVELELRPGGDVKVAEGDDERGGFVEEVDPERRLSFWWSREAEDATRVELELEDVDDGTLVRVTESRPLETVAAEAHELASDLGGSRGPEMTALAGV